MNRKILAVLLTLLLLAQLLLSCTDKGDPTDPTPSDESTESTAEPTETVPRTFENLEKVDLKGKTFCILTRDGANTVIWKPLEWISDGESDQPIPSAVFKRNKLVEEKFNCSISQKQDDDYIALALADNMANGSDYDVVVVPYIHALNSLAISGYLYDMAELKNMSLDDPWWNQPTNDSLSLLRHYYTVSGDLDIVDNLATWCVMFNKDMSRNLTLENHYQIVKDKKWTLERMYENAKKANDSLSTDQNKVYGIALEYESAPTFLVASGHMTFMKDDQDIPKNIMRTSAGFTDVIEGIYDRMKDRTVNIYGDNDSTLGVNWGQLYNTFVYNQALYCMGTLANVVSAQISNMQSAYGILPVPMYQEAVGEYISTASGGNATGCSILAHRTDAETVATFLTAVSAASTETLVPAFYEQTLYGRKVPDPESLDTLNIILSNRKLDIGYLLSNGVRKVFREVFTKTDSYSGYQGIMNKYSDMINNDLDHAVKAIQEGFQKQ